METILNSDRRELMAYLNVDLNYFEHLKTIRLASLLGPGSESLPIKLWCHAGKFHASTGVLVGYSIKEIEGVVGWKGAEGEFVSSMVKVGYMALTPDGYALHEWLDHEGHLVMFKERAKRAAFKRWGMGDAISNAKDDPKQCPFPSLPTQTKDTPKPRKGVVSETFEYFWLAYPKKRSKGQALKAWRNLKPSTEQFNRILEAVERAKKSTDWEKESGQYIPYPATWLNAHGWEDEIKTQQAKPDWRDTV